jgi:hypothetical protein
MTQTPPKGVTVLNARNRENPLYFPLFVDLSGRRAAVVGGGLLAAKRAATLNGFGASVKLIAPKLGFEAERLVRAGKAAWLRAEFAPALLEGCDLIVAAERRAVNHAVSEAAKEMCILCSVEDSREESSFVFPTARRLAQRIVGRYFGRKHTYLVCDLYNLLCNLHMIFMEVTQHDLRARHGGPASRGLDAGSFAWRPHVDASPRKPHTGLHREPFFCLA